MDRQAFADDDGDHRLGEGGLGVLRQREGGHRREKGENRRGKEQEGPFTGVNLRFHRRVKDVRWGQRSLPQREVGGEVTKKEGQKGRGIVCITYCVLRRVPVTPNPLNLL